MSLIDRVKSLLGFPEKGADFEAHKKRLFGNAPPGSPEEARFRQALAELKSPDSSVRDAGVAALSAKPVPAPKIVEALVEALAPIRPKESWQEVPDEQIKGLTRPSGPDTQHGLAGVKVLVAFGIDGRPGLLRVANCWNPDVAKAAFESYLTFGDEVMPSLVNGLMTGNIHSRSPICRELARLSEEAFIRMGKRAVPHLQAGLLSPEFDLKRRILRVLGRLGPDAATSIPALTQILRLPQPPSKDLKQIASFQAREIRQAIFSTLKQIGTPEAIDVLQQFEEK